MLGVFFCTNIQRKWMEINNFIYIPWWIVHLIWIPWNSFHSIHRILIIYEHRVTVFLIRIKYKREKIDYRNCCFLLPPSRIFTLVLHRLLASRCSHEFHIAYNKALHMLSYRVLVSSYNHLHRINRIIHEKIGNKFLCRYFIFNCAYSKSKLFLI